MAKLQMLKPRVSTLKAGRVDPVGILQPGQARASSTQRGYGYKWQQARAAYFAKHPLCAECERQGRVVEATDLDHIIPHRGDMRLFWDRANWQGLCASCHSRKTSREDGGFGNVGRPR